MTKRRKTVAHLPPAARKKTIRSKIMPDVAARLHKVFGQKTISDQAMNEIMDESRGSF